MEDLLSCQQAMLDSIQCGQDWRVYRCEIADRLCVVAGDGPDEEVLFINCGECEKKPASLEHQTGGLSRG